MSRALRVFSWHSPTGRQFFFLPFDTLPSLSSSQIRGTNRGKSGRVPWMVLQSPLNSLAFVDRRTRGIGQRISERASERVNTSGGPRARIRRGEVAWEISRALNVSQGVQNQRHAAPRHVDDEAEACRNEILHYSTLSFPCLSHLFHSRSSGQVRSTC